MRLFIGIDLPDKLKQTLLKFQSQLKNQGVDGFWKSEENFHVTLEFFGELEANTLLKVTEILSEKVKHHQQFKLEIIGLGAFPSFKRPHTLWTGVGGELNGLNQLRAEVHTELEKEGFILESREFRPHITLASRPQFDNIDLSVFKIKKFGEFLVGEIILFESKVIQGKRIYRKLYRAGLNS